MRNRTKRYRQQDQRRDRTRRNVGFYSQKKDKEIDIKLFVRKASQERLPQEIVTGSFASYAISDELKRNIVSHNYITPTSIQDKAIPPIILGRDVIGIANTGTGKTAAFLVPLIDKVFKNRSEHVLIVTPTRELATQIVDEFYAFSRGMGLNAALCIGGTNLASQERNLGRNPNFVIGTPGRLRDFIERNKIKMGQFHSIVLDEVDRMVDIGFIGDIKFFISLLPKNRQSLFFSATVDKKVEVILREFVNDPLTVSSGRQETSSNVEQDIVEVGNKAQKVEILHNLLIQDGFDKVLVFGQTKRGVEKLTRILIERGFRAASIHSNKSQGQRRRALEQFKDDRLQILLATDVASRGLDINNVTHVINYDTPESYDDYIHRIGRTGRADKKGMAITFVE